MAGAVKDWTRKVILMKNETTEGTDAAPTSAANAFQVLNYQPQFMDSEKRVRAIEKAYFGANKTLMSGFRRGATFDMELAGSGAAGTAAPWQLMLPYAGFGAAVIVASTKATSNPTSTIPSATHWGYLDDLLLKAVGCKASVGFTIEDDAFPYLSFSFLGVPPVTMAEQAVPSAATISGYRDPVTSSTENSTFTYDGYALPLRRWTMNANAELNLRSLIGPADRIKYSDRGWTGEVVARVPDLTAFNPFTRIRPGSTFAASFVNGTVAGDIIEVNAPTLQITDNVTLSEEQGEVMVTIPVTALPNTGNDEVNFVAR